MVPVPVTLPGCIVQVPDAGNPVSSMLPVAWLHEVCVTVPTVGAAGVAGCALMTTFADGKEVHPAALVTVKLCVPVASPEMVVLGPVPVTAPGLIVQLPVGNPVNTTLPVAKAQVGCVIVPTPGNDGVAGCALMTTLADGSEVHPEALVTVKLYVPAVSNEMVVLVPVPVTAPGLIVQVPDAGNPFSTTLPVARAQVG